MKRGILNKILIELKIHNNLLKKIKQLKLNIKKI